MSAPFQMPSSPVPPEQPATPATKANPVRELNALFETSDGWDMSIWTASALVLARAGLQHMLRTVETEMHKRKMIATLREPR